VTDYRVVIAEDDESSRIFLHRMLVAKGYAVRAAINGIEALQLAKESTPDIIISDIMMPEMDGFELCRQIKQDESLCTIPFVFYTATYTDSQDESLAQALGAAEFIIKPSPPDLLMQKIETVLREHQAGLLQVSETPIAAPSPLDAMYTSSLARKLDKKIQELEAEREELKLSALVFENSSEGMMVTDAEGYIITINPAFTSVTGYTPEEAIGKKPSFLKSDHHDQAFYQALWQELNTTGQWKGEIWNLRKNGEIYPELLTINTSFKKDGSPFRRVALFSDITEKKKSEEMIWRQANFDALTGLPNRYMFHDRIEQEVKKVQQTGRPLALLFLDIDHFKEVNDTLGHGKGDLLLKEAAQRIAGCVSKSNIVARLGGDEFSIIITDLADSSSVESVVQKLLHSLAEPFMLGIEVAYVSASIGITFYPTDTDEIESLLKNADQAMYAAKQHGRNRYSFFTPSMQEAVQARMRLATDLRTALNENQFLLHYQPIVELNSGHIFKAEVLIRWQHPVRGLVSPVEFIPIAEDTGLIIGIGDWVFREAVRQVNYLRTAKHRDLQISVNMSPVQFQNLEENYASWFNYMQELGLPGNSIAVEITESLLLDSNAAVTDKLSAFRSAGMQVSLDDFGTGYSALSYLKKFDIDFLKIDQSFVRNLTPGSQDLALCEAIIMMAHKLGIKVIAEGIETTQQRDLLAAAGCDYGQGYLFSRPLPADEFEQLL
jgi:diguanylate cyclase (GGDEF)-like protein/PAS domain S-box-containing protein